MAYGEPYFKNGRLVQDNPITRFRSKQMDAAASWLPVESRSVRAICWRPESDKTKQTGVGVWFKSKNGPDTVYWYTDAPFEIYQEMRNSASKGVFVQTRLRGKFKTLGPFRPGA